MRTLLYQDGISNDRLAFSPGDGGGICSFKASETAVKQRLYGPSWLVKEQRAHLPCGELEDACRQQSCRL